MSGRGLNRLGVAGSIDIGALGTGFSSAVVLRSIPGPRRGVPGRLKWTVLGRNLSWRS